jgi:hypothetical protein
VVSSVEAGEGAVVELAGASVLLVVAVVGGASVVVVGSAVVGPAVVVVVAGTVVSTSSTCASSQNSKPYPLLHTHCCVALHSSMVSIFQHCDVEAESSSAS